MYRTQRLRLGKRSLSKKENLWQELQELCFATLWPDDAICSVVKDFCVLLLPGSSGFVDKSVWKSVFPAVPVHLLCRVKGQKTEGR